MAQQIEFNLNNLIAILDAAHRKINNNLDVAHRVLDQEECQQREILKANLTDIVTLIKNSAQDESTHLLTDSFLRDAKNIKLLIRDLQMIREDFLEPGEKQELFNSSKLLIDTNRFAGSIKHAIDAGNKIPRELLPLYEAISGIPEYKDLSELIEKAKNIAKIPNKIYADSAVELMRNLSELAERGLGLDSESIEAAIRSFDTITHSIFPAEEGMLHYSYKALPTFLIAAVVEKTPEEKSKLIYQLLENMTDKNGYPLLEKLALLFEDANYVIDGQGLEVHITDMYQNAGDETISSQCHEILRHVKAQDLEYGYEWQHELYYDYGLLIGNAPVGEM